MLSHQSELLGQRQLQAVQEEELDIQVAAEDKVAVVDRRLAGDMTAAVLMGDKSAVQEAGS